MASASTGRPLPPGHNKCFTGSDWSIVTHEMKFAREVADRVVFMDKGLIVEQGPPANVFDTASHERTRLFLQRVAR